MLAATVALTGLRAASERSSWEITTSADARARYDSNVFLQDEAPTVGGQPAALPARATTWAAQIGASIGATWRSPDGLAFSGSYVPELWRYRKFTSENHDDHRVILGASYAHAPWRFEANTNLLIVDGDREAPIFNRVGATPAIGGEPVRSRRAQSLAKGSVLLSRDVGQAMFVRIGASGIAQDFHTRQAASPTGYANYVDRGEAAATMDLGWRLAPKLSVFAAERHGRQRQADLLGVPLGATSDFDRWLVGVEGQLVPNLKVSLLAGPDVRRFGTHMRAGFDRRRTERYFEGTAAWTLSPADALAFSGKSYLWLSSGGRGAYIDGLYDLTWKHVWSKKWAVNTTANFHEGDAHDYGTAARHDRIVTVGSALTWTGSTRTRIECSLVNEVAVSAVPNTPGRAYRRWLPALGFTRIF